MWIKKNQYFSSLFFILLLFSCQNNKTSLNNFEKGTIDSTTLIFENHLFNSSYFKNAQGFNIFINPNDTLIYIIFDKSKYKKDKFMLHFIKEDNTFINYSFEIEKETIANFNKSPYNKYIIIQKTIPNFNEINKIRLGQYTSIKNIWVQEFVLKEILNNPLLHYNNQLLKE
ncbi:MAG: hypothetical protein CO068_04635 [Flavobacteriaceae bacterium CG_4_9_14_0_8_um_filter_34_30]|nr:hypothetical protein [Bacteroidota bacterium]PJC07734.1 MAG: hypothetical protein CO068_04635 [Flavobacteriaceae bacterium CG_4_9_14_0_8_um_filter_34_30]